MSGELVLYVHAALMNSDARFSCSIRASKGLHGRVPRIAPHALTAKRRTSHAKPNLWQHYLKHRVPDTYVVRAVLLYIVSKQTSTELEGRRGGVEKKWRKKTPAVLGPFLLLRCGAIPG